MTAVNFPSSPSNGDTLTSGNTTYTYNSTKTRWDAVTTVNGIQLNSLSVGAEAAASGDGGIAYDNTSGEFTYTPPVTGDSLPSQTDNSGKFLTTDGTDASWATVAAGAGYEIGDGLELTDPVTTVTWPASPVLTATQVSSLSGKWLGGSVAASADYVVGGYINLGGQVEVYNARTGAFIRTISPPTSNTSFGQSCSIDGVNLVVGAPGQRKAYIYNVETGALLHTLSGATQFGAAVAIKGNYAIVGTQESGISVFNVTTGSLLYTIAYPNADGGSTSDYFSHYGLSMTSSHIIASAPYSDPNGFANAGSLYIFNIADGSTAATVHGSVAQRTFGHNVSADGDLVGVYYNNTVVLYSISALVADSSSNPIRTITRAAGSAALFGYFGMSLSGNYIGIGATSSNTNGSGAGAAELYDVTDGSLVYSIEGAAAQDQMGYGVAVAPGVFAAGAPGTDSPTADSGSIYIYNGTVSSTSYLQPDSTIATTSYVDTSVSNLVDSSPAALNTLNELAAALGDDANFSTTVTNSIATKAPLADPTFTGVPAAPTATAGTNTTQLATTAFVTAANAAAGDGLPTQTDNSGKYLTTDGTDASWATVSAGAGYEIGDGLELDSVTSVDWDAAASYGIDGVTADKKLGNTITASADYVVVGYKNYDRVEVYNARTGVFLRTIICPDGANQNFGYSKRGLQLDGVKLIVGALVAKKAYIFDVSDGSLLRTIVSTRNDFGYTVAMKGNYAAVGSGSGLTIYNVTTGSELYTISNPNVETSSSSDSFNTGYLSLTPSYIVTSAPDEDVGAINSGTLYIFDITDGTLVCTRSEPAQLQFGYYGAGLSADGDRLAVSRHTTTIVEDGTTRNVPRVELHSITALISDPLSDPYLVITDPNAGGVNGWNNQFGFNGPLSISGNYVAVGARDRNLYPNGGTPGEIYTATQSGAAYLFNATDGTLLSTKLGTTAGEFVGFEVAVASGVFAWSAPNKNSNLGFIGINAGDITTNTYLQPDSTIATTSYVDTSVSNLVDSSPAALNTLNELAAALGDDANFSTTVTNSIATKAPLADPSFTGVPAAPTAATGTNTTQLATTAFVTAAAGDTLPAQTDNSGKYLTTDGSTTSWATVSAGAGYEIGDGLELNSVSAVSWPASPNLVATINGITNQGAGRSIKVTDQYTAVGSQDYTKLTVHDSSTGALLRTFNNPDGLAAWGLYFGISGDNIALAHQLANKVFIYSVSTGSLLRTFTNPGNFESFGADVVIEGNVVAINSYGPTAGNYDGYLHVYNISTGELLWEKANPNTDGGTTDDAFRGGLAISTNYIIQGAGAADTGASNSGIVYILDKNTGDVVRTISPPSPAADQQFGVVCSISGTTLAVGTNDTRLGLVYLFDVLTGNLLATVSNPGAADSAGDSFGNHSFAIDGNYLAVGAQSQQLGAVGMVGAAYLFDISDFNNITTVYTLRGISADDNFGVRLDMFQGVLAVGAHQPRGTMTGAAYIYNGTVSSTSYLQPDSTIATTAFVTAAAGDTLPAQTDNSGKFLTTDGTDASWATVSAGAGYEIGDGLELNSVSAVSWPASPNLISTINGSAASKQLGYNIAASADYVVAGYIDHDRVEVYNARTGAFLRSIICPDGTGKRFGKHGIDIDGTNLIVGAPGSGKAYIFDITNGSTLQTFSSSSVEFGIHVSIKGNYAAVSDYHTSDSDWIGKFTVYNVTTGSQLYVVNNPNAGGGDAGDNFAKDGLDMTASYIVTAGWREDTGASGSGTAYVFDITDGTLLATVLNPNPVSNGFFGYGIAADGDYLGVFAFTLPASNNVYVYSLSALVANASASPIYTISNPSPDGNTSDQFGWGSVSIAGTFMAVGAKAEDVGSGSSGSSYLYDLSDGTLLYSVSGASGDDNMGTASAVGTGVFVTGSPQNDSGGSNNGSIGIYNGTVSSTSYLQPDSTIATTSYVAAKAPLADPTFTGTVTLPQTAEVSTALTSATGTVAHDLSNSALFVHSSISADFTANFTNVPTTDDRTTSVALVLVQGGTAYIPTAVQIDGSTQTILWQGSAAPTGTASKHDIVSFSLIRSGGAWTVVGSLTTYGA